MQIIVVHVHVKPGFADAFIAATAANATASRKEPGVARFDVIRQREDPNRFVLIEAYRDDDAPAKHKETGHYALWRDTVAPMMMEPRTSVKYSEVSPAAGA